jgi:hypothetical protein
MENKQKQTQQQMILDAFRANGGILTPSDIMKLGIAQYNARIYELKHKGYRITSEYLGTVGGVKRTVFRLELDDVLTSFKTEKYPRPKTLKIHLLFKKLYGL